MARPMLDRTDGRRDEPRAVEASPRDRVLAESALDTAWRICFLANAFVFPLYGRLETEFDVARPEFVTMFCLAHAEPLVAQDIVDMTRLPKNSISRGVNRLIARGIVAREADPGDGRRSILRLTAAGRELYERLMPIPMDRQLRLLRCLTDEEKAELDRLLMKLAAGAAEAI